MVEEVFMVQRSFFPLEVDSYLRVSDCNRLENFQDPLVEFQLIINLTG